MSYCLPRFVSYALIGLVCPATADMIKEAHARDERRVRNRVRRLAELGLPHNVDDMMLAKRQGHHLMVPEEIGWLMGCV